MWSSAELNCWPTSFLIDENNNYFSKIIQRADNKTLCVGGKTIQEIGTKTQILLFNIFLLLQTNNIKTNCVNLNCHQIKFQFHTYK